jgi:hypothetical protein
MDVVTHPAVSRVNRVSAEVVRVPVTTLLYQQAMAEHGEGDRPRPMGFGLPSGHVSYRQ